jgi:3-dehydroquinate dehydratase-2
MTSSAKPIYILNGPNLNRLGRREPEIYGGGGAPPRPVEFRQSNSESQLIDWIHEAIDLSAGIVINPAAYSFTSIAILDALKMFPGPIVELHISNIHRREPHYHHSFVSKVATAVIAGLGPDGYPVAVRAIEAMIERAPGA